MSEVEDLTASELEGVAGRALTVGFLGPRKGFTTGPVASEIIDELIKLAVSPANMTRGVHHCEFCDQESPIQILTDHSPRGRIWLGSGEIHVPDPDGAVLVAPTLIIHYIIAHGYQPPDRFCDAVEALREAETT